MKVGQPGDHQALCFLLLDGADVQQKTLKGESAWDLAQAANKQGSHDQAPGLASLCSFTPGHIMTGNVMPAKSEEEADANNTVNHTFVYVRIFVGCPTQAQNSFYFGQFLHV